MSAPLRTLTDLWPELGIDERLSILIEQQTAELRQLADHPDLTRHTRARIAGYANAVADILYYVVEGNPPPDVEEVGS